MTFSSHTGAVTFLFTDIEGSSRAFAAEEAAGLALSYDAAAEEALACLQRAR